MLEQLTTFRNESENGLQQHESTAAEEVIPISEELIDYIGELGESYQQDETSASLEIGIGLWVPGSRSLNKLPEPNFRDRMEPNISLFPLLDVFGKFLHSNTKNVFNGLRPSYIRVTAIGPESRKDNTWHCDPIIEKSSPSYFISRTPQNVGRIVMNVDSLLRNDRNINIQFADGGFSVSNVVVETDNAEKWQDLYEGYPDGATVVTREAGSIVCISDKDFEPSAETIRSFDNLTLTNLGSTTLHAAVPNPDAVRLSLQCFYDGFEKIA